MSLFLSYEEMWDLPLGTSASADSKKRVTHWVGNIVYAVVAFVFKVCFRYHVDGRENIRAFDGVSGVLIASNHTSFLDVAFMYVATRPKQWVRFMAREDLFPLAKGLFGQLIGRVGAFPIKRESADTTAIKRATRMLKSGEVVGILPEGTRRGKGSKTPQIHSGMAFIARMARVPVLPMTVRDAENVKRKGERLRFPKVTVEYGTPVLLADFDFLPKDDRLEACTWYTLRECFALSKRIRPEEVDMRELFPDSRDFTEVFAEHPIPRHSSAEVAANIAAAKAAAATKDAAKAAAATKTAEAGALATDDAPVSADAKVVSASQDAEAGALTTSASTKKDA